MLTVCASKDKFRSVTVNDLVSIPVPTREQIGAKLKEGVKGTWKPISHFELVSEVYASLLGLVPNFETQDLYVSKDGFSLILGVTLPGYLDTPDLVPGLFVRHSNDQSQSLQIGVGGQVFVCSNGMITASWTERTKHRDDLDLPSFVNRAIGKGLRSFGEQQSRIRDLKGLQMERPAEALLQMVRAGDMNQRTCHAAWDEWCCPSYEYEGTAPESRWSWYNAITHVAKGLATTRQSRLLERAFQFAENYS